MILTRAIPALALAALVGCRGEPPPSPQPAEPADAPTIPAPAREEPAIIELQPGLRVDRARRTIEFDGIVCIDAHDPLTPDVYLEVIVCTPDTKEHEALVMTEVPPSAIHAALLLAGFEPGEPGSWTWDGEVMGTVAPTGDAIDVHLIMRRDGRTLEARASDWVVRAGTGDRLSSEPGAGWVFAGSRIARREGRRVYDADGTGTLVGLHTFGAETVAWRTVMSHEEAVQAPEWLADPARVPPFGTPVTVRLGPARPDPVR